MRVQEVAEVVSQELPVVRLPVHLDQLCWLLFPISFHVLATLREAAFYEAGPQDWADHVVQQGHNALDQQEQPVLDSA